MTESNILAAEPKIALANFRPNLNFAGFKSQASDDSWLSWEVCCGGICLIILILIILWLLWKWYKSPKPQSQPKEAPKS